MLVYHGRALLDQELLSRELAVVGDHPTPWQVVSLLLCMSMTALSADIDKKICGRSRDICELGMNSILLGLVVLWRVGCPDSGQTCMNTLKWSRSSEYLYQPALVVRGVVNTSLYYAQEDGRVPGMCQDSF